MCGIFGYVGTRTAQPILIEGLRALEYRGYDSAGIYIPGHPVVRAVGPIDALAGKLTKTLSGTSGIAHTRWATHGAPSEQNAHPHQDASGRIFLVHNGIIENYQGLKEGLVAQGMTFRSDTDTEVLAKLIGSAYDGNLEVAVRTALSMVRGAYGIAVMSEREPDTIVVARMGSPIVLGVAEDGNLVASDPSALLPHTKDVIYLDDGDIAVITKDSYRVSTHTGREKDIKAERILWDAEAVQKQGYRHFMEKEIFEAPSVIENTIRGRLIPEKGRAKLGGLDAVAERLSRVNHLTIAACGSAYYAGLVGKYLLETYARIPVSIELASEYRYRAHPERAPQHHALIAVTQSGETADTLAAVRTAKEQGILTLGIVNVVGSTIARETDAGVYNHAGPEVAVASTKGFISQVAVFGLLSLLLGRDRGMSVAEGEAIAEALMKLPSVLESMLKNTSAIETIAKAFATRTNVMYIGRQTHMAVAAEGALKLKEVTYIHAEAYAGGELKHGPIALLDTAVPVVAIAPHDHVYEKMVSNIEEVKARKAPVIAIATEHDVDVARLADEVITIPSVHPIVQPIVSTVPLHLLAYYVGREKGLNVDRPRNLAKSVTVE